MNWKDLFQRFGQPSTEARIDIHGYLRLPDRLVAKDIKFCDESAARVIQECEETAAALREYRQALAARYAQLSTMPYTYRLELKREKAWKGAVTYYLRLLRVYEDGHEEIEQRAEYPGTARHKAIKDYQAALKTRPGIDAVMNIEKGRWER